MEASIRPWFTTGVALVGASATAMAPVAPIAPSSLAAEVRAATAAISSEFQLTAVELPYIIALPIVRQYLRNWAQNWGVYLAGLARSGVGLAESLLSIPGVTVEIVQQVLALDFVGAFNTLTSAIRDSVIAVGQPLLDSLIWRNQKLLAVQTALQAAVPQALIDVANGFLAAGNGVVTALIEGTQELVAAILTLNLGNIIAAAVDGTADFFVALGAGAGAIVDGIESAQLGIATALATEPPSTMVVDVSGLSTFSVARTFSLPAESNAVMLDVVGQTPEQPTLALDDGAPPLGEAPVVLTVPALQEEGPTGVVDVVDTTDVEPQDAPEALPAAGIPPAHGSSDDPIAPADPPKPVVAPPVKDTPKEVDETVEKVAAGVEKGKGGQHGAAPNAEAEAPEKPASGADE